MNQRSATRYNGEPLDRSRPVIILDGRARGDLGVVRSLGLAGLPVHLLTSNLRSTTTASRYVEKVHPFPSFSASDDEKIARLRDVASGLEDRPLVLATGDSALRFLSASRAGYEDLIDHDLASEELLSNCLDKDRFAAAAKRLDLPVPDTFAPRNAAEMEGIAGNLTYPVFVKPVFRETWSELPREVIPNVKGMRVDTAEALLRLSRALDEHSPDAHRMVVQTMVLGGDDEHMSVHAYVDREGRVLGAFTGKKLRIWPPHAGVGAMVMSHDMPGPRELALDVLEKLQYTGFAILQFKRDARTGRYQLLEINCRYSTWTELPSRAGCNFPYAAYATITGQSVRPMQQREGISWLDVERDLGSMSAYRKQKTWSWIGYFGSLRSVRCWAFFAWDDPKPFFRKLRTHAN